MLNCECHFKLINIRTISPSLLQELTGSVPDSDVYSTGAEEAFESAVNTYTTRENREVLWLEYLAFKERRISKMPNKREGVKSFFDAVKRCLASMPTSRTLPHQVSMYWHDYGFHNKVCSVFIYCRASVYRYMEE